MEDIVHDIVATVSDQPVLAVIVIVLLMIVHNFVPIPAEAIAVVAGAMLGMIAGVIAIWIGAMLGACLAFWISRRWGRALVLRLVPTRYVNRLDGLADRSGWPGLLIVRLIPVISFNLVNYAAGLTTASWSTFLWTTAVGILPITIISVGVGAHMAFLPVEYLLIFAVGLTLVAVVRHYWR